MSGMGGLGGGDVTVRITEFFIQYQEELGRDLASKQIFSLQHLTEVVTQFANDRGFNLTNEEFKDFIDTPGNLEEYLPEQKARWDNLRADVSNSDTPSVANFINEISTNARDPFQAIKGFGSRFQEPKAIETNYTFSGARVANSYQATVEFQANRLYGTLKQGAFKTDLETRAAVYETHGGFLGRATGLDIYSLLTNEQNSGLTLKGSFYQLQSTEVMAGLAARSGDSYLVTQSIGGADTLTTRLQQASGKQKELKEIAKQLDIYAGNDVATRAASRLDNVNIGQVSMASSVHPKMAYLHEASNANAIGAFMFGTQNLTLTMSQTTTVDDMVWINKPMKRLNETAEAYATRLATFQRMGGQVKAATDAMLSYVTSSGVTDITAAGGSADFFQRFMGQVLGQGSTASQQQDFTNDRFAKGGVFTHREIRKVMERVVGSAASTTGDQLMLSMQYIEKALVSSSSPYGSALIDSLKTLSDTGRLKIGVSGNSIGEDQGLYWLLDKYEELKGKDLIRSSGLYKRRELIASILEKNNFTLLPTQFQHSKSFAVFGADNALKAYGLGSANASSNALNGRNIETFMLFTGESLDLFDERDQANIKNEYLFGIGWHQVASNFQGMQVERNADSAQVLNAIKYLKALGGKESREQVAGKFTFSRRYSLGNSKEGYTLSGLDITLHNPMQGGKDYNISVTLGSEYRSVTRGGRTSVEAAPIMYINRTQRMINGALFKNNADYTFNIQSYNPAAAADNQITLRALQKGETYQANAIEVLGGFVTTMRSSMLYESQVRSISATYHQLDTNYVKQGLDQLLSRNLRQTFKGLIGKELVAKKEGLALTLRALKEQSSGEEFTKIINITATSLGSSNNPVLPANERRAGNNVERTASMLTLFGGMLQEINKGSYDVAANAGVKNLLRLVNASVGINQVDGFDPAFSGRYNDMVMSLINADGGARSIYQEQVAQGQREAYHRIVDAFQQPHTQNYSQGQALHTLPVFGLNNLTFHRLRLGGHDGQGIILNPYGLSHGEQLGLAGDYLRSVGGSAGRANREQFFQAYGGLQKIEGGAPVVHDMVGLMKSMPTLEAISRKDYVVRTAALLAASGSSSSLATAKSLAAEVYAAYKDEDIDEQQQMIYYFPYAKTEQISQRMKNLTSARPMYDASREFIDAALTLGQLKDKGFKATDFDLSKTNNIIGGALLTSMPTQQYTALVTAAKRNLSEKENITDYEAELGKELLRLAKEWSINDKQMGKGFLGSEKPRLVALVAGGTQLSDYGLFNPEYNKGSAKDGRYEYGMKFLKPHPVQITGTLSGAGMSPATLQAMVTQRLQPGTFFVARSTKIEHGEVLSEYATKLQGILRQETGLDSITLGSKDLSRQGIFAQLEALDDNVKRTAYSTTLERFKAANPNLSISYKGDSLEFFLKKGVYSAGGDLIGNASGDTDALDNDLIKRGSLEAGDSQFTIFGLDYYDEHGVTRRASSFKLAIPAYSARELNGITVLGAVNIAANTNNTFTIDGPTYTIEDFMSGMRMGSMLPKGPMRSAGLGLFEALAEIYSETTGAADESLIKLLPPSLAPGGELKGIDVFAYLAPSQIKAFNPEIGLAMFRQANSGIYNRLSTGTGVAEALSLYFLGLDNETLGGGGNRKAFLEALSAHLGDTERKQYADYLKLEAGRINAKDAAVRGAVSGGGLSMWSGLAALVDLNDGESLEGALLRTTTAALGGNTEALKRLAEGGKSLMNYILNDGDLATRYKEGDTTQFLIQDTFETKPLGILGFLAKASADIYADIKDRKSRGALGELILNKESVFSNFEEGFKDVNTNVGLFEILTNLAGDSRRDKYQRLQQSILRRELYTRAQQLNKATGGNVARVINDANLNSAAALDSYFEGFKAIITGNSSTELDAGLEAVKTLENRLTSNNFEVVGYEILNRTGVVNFSDMGEGSRMSSPLIKAVQALTANINEGITTRRNLVNGAQRTRMLFYSDADTLNVVKRGLISEAQVTYFKKVLGEEISKSLVGNSEAAALLTDLKQKFGLSDDQVRTLTSQVTHTNLAALPKHGNRGFYSAVEAYAGYGGAAIQQGVYTMAQQFGYTLAPYEKIKSILETIKGGGEVNAKDATLLEETQRVFEAVETYVQQQRHIWFGIETSASKIATPTGNKNTTALEGHLARTMTARQLELYTYNPSEYTDVGTVQQALVTLGLIYKGAAPSQGEMNNEYGLRVTNLSWRKMYELANSNAVAGFAGGNSGVQQRKKVIKNFKTQQIVYGYLANYSTMGRQALQGTPSNLTAAEKLIDQLSGKSLQSVNNEHLTKLTQIALGEVMANSEDPEAVLERRSRLAAEYIYDEMGGASKHRDTIKKELTSWMKETFVTYTKPDGSKGTRVTSISVMNDAQKFLLSRFEKLGDSFDVAAQQTYLNLYLGKKNITASRRAEYIDRVSNENWLRERIVHTQQTNNGKSYLEAMKSLHHLAVTNNNKLVQDMLRVSQMVALPSYETLTDDGSGEIRVRRRFVNAAEGQVTGVILGLDVLEKMSLLFQTDSHPALKAQHLLMQQLVKTQGIVDRIEDQMFKKGFASLDQSEMQELNNLMSYMEASKRTAVDILNNKNSIRQATGNRLNMMGASYIAVNSLLVGVNEVALGSRFDQAAGAGIEGGASRYVSITQLNKGELNDLMANPFERKILSTIYHEAFKIAEDPGAGEELRNAWDKLAFAQPTDQRSAIETQLEVLKGQLGSITERLIVQGSDATQLAKLRKEASDAQQLVADFDVVNPEGDPSKNPNLSFSELTGKRNALLTAASIKQKALDDYTTTAIATAAAGRSEYKSLNTQRSGLQRRVANLEASLGSFNSYSEIAARSPNTVLIHGAFNKVKAIINDTHNYFFVNSSFALGGELARSTYDLNENINKGGTITIGQFSQWRKTLASSNKVDSDTHQRLMTLAYEAGATIRDQYPTYTWTTKEKVTHLHEDSNRYEQLQDKKNEGGLNAAEQLQFDKLQSKDSLWRKLTVWTERMKELSHAYGKDARYVANITAETVMDKMQHSGKNEWLFTMEIITGKEVTRDNRVEVARELDQVQRKEVQEGRQGAPYWSFSSSRGAAPGVIGADAIDIMTEYNERTMQVGSLFAPDARTSGTLMLLSSFGLQFVGLGDYDGDSYQAAITSKLKIQSTISRRDAEIFGLERRLKRAQAGGNTPVNAEVTRLEKDIKALKDQRKDEIGKLRRLEESFTQKSYDRAEKAKAGVRSYISDYLALPSYLMGDDSGSGITPFDDRDLSSFVKQTRDTYAGLSDRASEVTKVVSAYAYLKTNDKGEIALNAATLKERFGNAEAGRLTKLITSRRQEFEATLSAAELSKLSLEEYKDQLAQFTTSNEAIAMSAAVTAKLFKNVTGSQITPTSIEEVQNLMGLTGGGLLGKVYNTVVPSVSGQMQDLLATRLLSDPATAKAFSKAVATGFGSIKGGGNNFNALQADLLNMRTADGTPWEVLHRDAERQAGTAFRFLLTTQQFLRDAALKPKQGGTLAAAAADFRLSAQAQQLLLDLKITGIDAQTLRDRKGLNSYMALEALADKKNSQLIDLVSQDFLGSVANTTLQKIGKDDGVALSRPMTAFAMLRILTDYAGTNDANANSLLSKHYLYGETLSAAKQQNEKTKAMTDDAFIRHTLADLITRFQADFSMSAVAENFKHVNVATTEKLLGFYGIELAQKNRILFGINDDNLEAGAHSRLQVDIDAYNRALGLSGDNLITIDDKAGITGGNEQARSALETRLAGYVKEHKTMQQRLLQNVQGLEGRGFDDTTTSELTKGAFDVLIKETVRQQTEPLVDQLLSLKSFNRAVNEVKNEGQTDDFSRLLAEQLDASGKLTSAATLQELDKTGFLSEKSGVVSQQLEATAYAIDTGKLSGEALYQAMSSGMGDLGKLVNAHLGSGKQLTTKQSGALYAYLAMGGVLPAPILATLTAAERGLSGAALDAHRDNVVQVLFSSGKRGVGSNDNPSIIETLAAGSGYIAQVQQFNAIAHTVTEQAGQMLAGELNARQASDLAELLDGFNKQASQLENQPRGFGAGPEPVLPPTLNAGAAAAEGTAVPTSTNPEAPPDYKGMLEEMRDLEGNIRTTMSVGQHNLQTKQTESTLRRAFAVGETLSILAVPMMFAALQGDISFGNQLQNVAAGLAQAAMTGGSFERSGIGASYNQDKQALQELQHANRTMQFARMQDYFRYYNSPTEALARGIMGEVIFQGAGYLGNRLGAALDNHRQANINLAGESGPGRLLTEVIAGAAGMVLSGVLSARPVQGKNTTEDDMALLVLQSASRAAAQIYNYLYDNVGSDSEDAGDDLQAVNTDYTQSLEYALRLGGGDADPSQNAALSTGEYLSLLGETNEEISTAEELMLQPPDGVPV